MNEHNLKPFKNILLSHGCGSGKTIASIAILEEYHKSKNHYSYKSFHYNKIGHIPIPTIESIEKFHQEIVNKYNSQKNEDHHNEFNNTDELNDTDELLIEI